MPEDLTEQRRVGEDQVFLGLSDLHVSKGDHVVQLYETREEWKSLVVPYLQTGLEAGEKCLYFMNGRGREELTEALEEGGVDVRSALASGQLMLDVGEADPREVVNAFPFVRGGGDMSVERLPTTEAIMEWETEVHRVEGDWRVILCQYDLKNFMGDLVIAALKTHPLSIVSNVIHQNPLFQSTEVVLQQMRTGRPESVS